MYEGGKKYLSIKIQVDPIN